MQIGAFGEEPECFDASETSGWEYHNGGRKKEQQILIVERQWSAAVSQKGLNGQTVASLLLSSAKERKEAVFTGRCALVFLRTLRYHKP